MFNLKLTSSQTVLFHTLESLLVGALIAGFVAILQYFESNSGNVNWNALLGVFTSVVAGALLKGLLGAAVTTPATPTVQPVAQGPLVSITHNVPADTQVSSAALPQPVSTQPMNTAPPMVHQGLVNVPPGQGTLTYMTPPQGTAVQSTGGWQVQSIMPQGESPSYQVDRNWTGLMPTVPPGQQTQQQS